jgi:hypothetical protein
MVPVRLAARCTEIGTLEIYCVAHDGDNRWRLEFNVRDIIDDQTSEGEKPAVQKPSDVWPEDQVQEAARLIRAVYAGPESAEASPKDLTKHLETALEAARDKWPTGLCRRLWEFLAEVADQRKRSPAHLSRWYHLTGYCLRPGFGDPLDKYRVEQLWKLLHAPPKEKTAVRIPESGADYWIMWRRVSGGLNPTLQQAIYDRLRPILLPAKGKSIAKPNANELAEMWRAAASLERLDVKHKQALGDALLKPLRRSPVPTYGFWALTRLGARVLLYGPLNAVLHHEIVEKWIEAIFTFQPGNDSERLSWAFCLTNLAKRSGQRALDVDDKHRENVLELLRSLQIPAHWRRMVEEVTELEGEEQSQMFGESLPIGLRLVNTEN